MRRRTGPLGGKMPMVRKHLGSRQTITVPVTVPGMEECPKMMPVNPVEVAEQQFVDADVKTDETETLSAYYKTKQDNVKLWASLRRHLLNCAYDTASPEDLRCAICSEEIDRMVKCEDCGPKYIVCQQCANKDHIIRPLHNMHIWNVSDI